MSEPGAIDVERLIADRLASLSLTGDAFGPEDIAADYLDRLEMDASLDSLIGAADAGPDMAAPS